MQNIAYEELSKKSDDIKISPKLRSNIISARDFSKKRNENLKIKNKLNKNYTGKELHAAAALGESEVETLNRLANNLNISPRAYHRVQRVARTIADLEGSEKVTENHILEAFQYRPKLNIH